jgi:hypothetical protein
MITEDEEIQESLRKDAQFEKRVAFATYTEDALVLFHDIMNISDDDFFKKYKTFKRIFIGKIGELVAAIHDHDYQKRSQLYDYFIEVL